MSMTIEHARTNAQLQVFSYQEVPMQGESQVTLPKSEMLELIQQQPDDAPYDEIMRELSFMRMVDRGLEDARAGKTIANEGMAHRIRTWTK